MIQNFSCGYANHLNFSALVVLCRAQLVSNLHVAHKVTFEVIKLDVQVKPVYLHTYIQAYHRCVVTAHTYVHTYVDVMSLRH